MRLYAMMMVALLASCGRESSPEGRMSIRAEKLEQKIDSLAAQNRAILDSIQVINKELRALKLSH